MITRRTTLLCILLYCLTHFAIALCGASFQWRELAKNLLYLDSSWYLHIAQNGYTSSSTQPGPSDSVFAFFPLWPIALQLTHTIIPVAFPLQMSGAVLALGLFLFALGLMHHWQSEQLRPATFLGLWFFLFSPGSWVFFSNHTESLFLLLSWLALGVAQSHGDKKLGLLSASLLAGASALTRNQGIIVAVATALILCFKDHLPIQRRFVIFVASGLVSGLIYAFWPLYQYHLTNNPLISVDVQKNWHVVNSFGAYGSNFFWMSSNRLLRRLIFWTAIVSSLLLLRKSTTRWFGVYILMSTMLWPLQGNNLGQAYRFGAVLFPLWFTLGDRVSFQLRRWNRCGGLVMVVVALIFWITSATVSSYYFFPERHWPKEWPY